MRKRQSGRQGRQAVGEGRAVMGLHAVRRTQGRAGLRRQPAAENTYMRVRKQSACTCAHADRGCEDHPFSWVPMRQQAHRQVALPCPVYHQAIQGATIRYTSYIVQVQLNGHKVPPWIPISTRKGQHSLEGPFPKGP
eukprot:scaffold26811_cov18-Tisochrysis_lutea.AAC.1